MRLDRASRWHPSVQEYMLGGSSLSINPLARAPSVPDKENSLRDVTTPCCGAQRGVEPEGDPAVSPIGGRARLVYAVYLTCGVSGRLDPGLPLVACGPSL